MTIDEFVKKFADLFEDTDPAEITADTEFQNLDEWDSLTALNIMAFTKTQFGKTLSGREIRSCLRVSDLHSLIESK